MKSKRKSATAPTEIGPPVVDASKPFTAAAIGDGLPEIHRFLCAAVPCPRELNNFIRWLAMEYRQRLLRTARAEPNLRRGATYTCLGLNVPAGDGEPEDGPSAEPVVRGLLQLVAALFGRSFRDRISQTCGYRTHRTPGVTVAVLIARPSELVTPSTPYRSLSLRLDPGASRLVWDLRGTVPGIHGFARYLYDLHEPGGLYGLPVLTGEEKEKYEAKDEYKRPKYLAALYRKRCKDGRPQYDARRKEPQNDLGELPGVRA